MAVFCRRGPMARRLFRNQEMTVRFCLVALLRAVGKIREGIPPTPDKPEGLSWVPERFKGPACYVGDRFGGPWVRIPPHPLVRLGTYYGSKLGIASLV